MRFKKVIFTGFAPNLRSKDLFRALKILFSPLSWSRWIKGKSIEDVEKWLLNFYGIDHAITIDSGRSALELGLLALGIGKEDEVIVQGFTCVVVINAIKHTGAKPIYVDINETLNIDIDNLYKKINSKTRAIIVQHTFGNPADMDSILEIGRQRGIKIIEDCAHSLGVLYKGKKVGTFGDFAILSFGSDKSVSCVRGGALITNDNVFFEKVSELHSKLPNTRRINIMQNLLHYIIFFKGKILYSLFLGKIILAIAKKMYMTGRIIYDCEKKGLLPNFYPTKMANSMAELLLIQLEDINIFLEHRKKIVNIYTDNIKNNRLLKPVLNEGSILLRYNLLTDMPDVLSIIAKNQKIILGDWYRGVVAPIDIDMEKINYEFGSCPSAENFAQKSVNLPTNINISVSDANRIVDMLNNY